jgi:Na+-translocating ferredoxin:NAD+ oxidoreductase RnfE subunit
MDFRLLAFRILAALCLIPGAALAQGTNLTWRWSNPAPFGNSIADLAWRTNRLYLAVGDRGSLWAASALPDWSRVKTGTAAALRGVAYLGDRAIVVGEGGVILWSDGSQFQTASTGRTQWLESVAASTDRAVAVGDGGVVMVSTDGIDWKATSVGRTNNLTSVTYASGLFVAVGDAAFVASSPDGLAWTIRNTGRTGFNLYRVAPVPTGVMAVGDAGNYVISRTAQLSQWDSGRIATTNALTAILAVGNERLVGGAGELRFGVNLFGSWVWSSEINALRANPAPLLTYQCLLWDGQQVVAGTRGGLVVTGTRSTTLAGFNWSYTEPTGIASIWDSLVLSVPGTNVGVSFSGTTPVFTTNTQPQTLRITAGEWAQFMDSADGKNWNRGLAPANASGVNYYGLGARPTLAVAAGSSGALALSRTDYVPLVSTNTVTNGTQVVRVLVTNRVNTLGIAWESVASGVTADLRAVCANSNLFVVAGSGGVVLTSPDAQTWTRRTSGTTAVLSGAAAWPGGFVVCGQNGILLTSANGLTWTARASGTTRWLWRVRWLDGRLVAVGDGGTVLTSTDGVVWTPRSTPSTTWWNDVGWQSGWYCLVGDGGLVALSQDLSNWAESPTATTRNLYTVCGAEGQWIVAGNGAAILRARAGPFDAPVQILNYPKTPEESLFLFGGQMDQTFRLERSADLWTWEEAVDLEISDPEGVLLLLDSMTNAPNAQFFRVLNP